jgi:hypothetical protein
MTDCEPSCRRRPHAEARYEWNTDESNAYESNAMDRSALLGMTTGAVVMFGFGVLWLLLGLFRGARSPAWLRLSLLFMGIVLGASIATLAVRSSGLPLDATPLTAQQVAINREIGRHFYLIFGAEVVAIFLVVAVLRIIHYPTYILCGIALIVGVHFVPLAALFKSPLFYGTGLGGCAIGLGGFFIADDGLRQKVVGISFGLLLWATAAWIAWVGLSALPGS